MSPNENLKAKNKIKTSQVFSNEYLEQNKIISKFYSNCFISVYN